MNITTTPEMPLDPDTVEDAQSPPPLVVIPDNHNEILLAAQDYDSRGYVLVPWGHQKKPLGDWGDVSLETNAAALETLSKPYMTDRNGRPLYPQLAIQCALSGLCVFDVDAKVDKKTGLTGFDSLQELEDEFGPLPTTPTALSHSRGKHCYFLDERFPKKTRFRPGIDIQSFGSCIIAPPTVNSLTGNAYQWLPGLGLDAIPLVEVPDWLRNALRAIEDERKHQWNGHGNGNSNGNGSTAPRPPLTGYDADTSLIYEGERDDTMFRIACSYRAKGLDYEDIARLLLGINQERCQPPLPESQVLQKAQSACRYPPGWTGETRDENKRPAPGIMFDPDAFHKLHTLVKDALTSRDTTPLLTLASCLLWNDLMDAEREDLFEQLRAGLGADFQEAELRTMLEDVKAETETQQAERPYQHNHGWNDTGNAERFVDAWGQDVLHVSPKGFDWYVWDGGRWKRDDGSKTVMQNAKETAYRIREDIKDIPPPAPEDEKDTERYEKAVAKIQKWSSASSNASRLSAMLTQAAVEKRVSCSYTDLNAHPYLLNVQNGVVDLRTGKLEPAKRNYRLTTQCPYPYDPEARCPRWMEFLEKIFEGDPKMISYIQWVYGDLLIGHNQGQRIYLLVGDGHNGKSTMLEVPYLLLGKEELALRIPFSVVKQQDNDDKSAHILAEMDGKRLIIVSESNRADTLAEGFIKRITGETSIMAERKYGHPFTVQITFTLILITNALPRIVGQEKGMWRRLKPIPLTYELTEEERDEDFIQNTLLEEFPGILRWMVAGAVRHQHEKEAEVLPEKCIKLKEQYREDNDPFSDFVEDCLTVKEGAFITTDDLNNLLRDWGQKNRAPALVSVGRQALDVLFRTCRLTPKVKYGRKQIEDHYPRGYHGVELTNGMTVRAIEKGGNARDILTQRLQSR